MPAGAKAKDNFLCPKCRNREAIARRVSLPKGVFSDFLGLKAGGRYLVLTCSLCGYTEFYDLAIVAREPAAELKSVPAPVDAEI
ncbi:MAG: zinc ribbon domain-containing protein [Candidatus Sumerlaeota bacterium]|nr:zinc ribbon domain-containing protein [Candidatus Sumerlaeota bacterium]